MQFFGMTLMKIGIAGAALLLNVAAGVHAGCAAEGPPPNLKPATVQGAGLNAVDLESQKAWYAAKLGMTVVSAIKAVDGSPREYILGAGADGTIVTLRKWPTGQPRPNATSRIILNVPDARGLVDWLKTQGVDNSAIVANVSYSIVDPEGNEIVLMTVGGSAVASASAPVTLNARCGNEPTKSRLLEGAYRMMAQGNEYEVSTAQAMYRQGLAQQSQFDENFSACLRSNSAK